MALHTDSPTSSPAPPQKSHASHTTKLPLHSKRQPIHQPPTIDNLPTSVLVQIFSYLQNPHETLAPSSPYLPIPTRLSHIVPATRVPLTHKRRVWNIPYEIHLGSVCKRWRIASHQLPHARILDIAAYLPTWKVVRMGMTERGLDSGYDLFVKDAERMEGVRGLSIHFPGTSPAGLKRVLERCGSGVTHLQIILRRGEWLNNGDAFDIVGLLEKTLEVVIEWLERVHKEVEAGVGIHGGLTELRIHSFITIRAVRLNLWTKLAKLCAGPIKDGMTKASSNSALIKQDSLSDYPGLWEGKRPQSQKTSDAGLKIISLRGVQTSSMPNPIHIFALHNHTIETFRIETGSTDLLHLSQTLPHLKSLTVGDVSLCRGNLAHFKALEELFLGRDDKHTWEQDGQSLSEVVGPDGYAAGRLLRSLSASTCARLKCLHAYRVPLADVMHVFTSHEASDSDDDENEFDTTIGHHHRPIHIFKSLYLTAIPRLTVANLILILDSCPLLEYLHVSLDESGCHNLEGLKRALVPAINLRNVVFRMGSGDYILACRRGIIRALEFAKPGTAFEVRQDG